MDMLPDAEHTLEKYLHLGETQELSQANAEAFNPQGQTTATVPALKYSKMEGKGSGKSSVNHVHSVALIINLVNVQLRRQSVEFVKRLGTMQKFVEINTGKQSNIMTGPIISLLDLQAIRRKAPTFTWW